RIRSWWSRGYLSCLSCWDGGHTGRRRLAWLRQAREHRGPPPAKRLPPMPVWSLPRSRADLLACFQGCFTVPTFGTFTGLVAGLVAQPGLRTVTGMLAGARLAGRWHHARAHRFFSAARWATDQVGLGRVGGVGARLLGAAAPIRLVVDDSLFKRR